jgi:tetratricopeptide (TPR) repeat protein
MDNSDYLMSFGSPAETKKNLEFLISANPNQSFLYQKSVDFKYGQKDFEGALRDAVKAIELDQTGKLLFDWKLTDILGKLSADPKIFEFYELLFNTARQKQKELSAKLKKLSPDSDEYKQIRLGIERTGNLISSVSFSWARIGSKLKNPQIESAALEKLMQNDVRWQAYQYRSFYYLSKGIADKAVADEFDYLLLHVEWTKESLKYSKSEKDQASLKNNICGLYSRLGELYFKNQQYVKAIDGFEKAKQFSTFNNNYLDSRIKTAMQKLNPTVEPAKVIPLNCKPVNIKPMPSNQTSPPSPKP